MIEALRNDMQALRAQDPAATITAICRQIASRHDWPRNAVAYKIYALGLNKVGAPTRQDSDSVPEAQPGDTISALPGGNITWAVHIDGLPFTWHLDVLHGHFPYRARSHISSQGNRYRLQRVQASSLHLASEEADVYDLRPQIEV